MTMQPHDLNSLARLATGSLLNSLVGGIIVAVITWSATRPIRRQGAGTRFVVWFVALIVLALLPWAGSVSTSSRLTAPALAASVLTLPGSFALYLFVAWMIGVSFGLARVGLSLYRLQRLRSTCIPVDVTQLDPDLRASLGDAHTHRRVTLCTSDIVRVPAAVGYFRPLVVFPVWALSEIPGMELNAILLHELAHLRRWDDWTNLAQKLVRAIFFFHPAVWFIESRLSLEREMACDDAVLAANFNPRAYAESLIGLAERSFLRRGIQLAQAAVSHVQQLKIRLAEILRQDKAQQGSGLVSKPAMVLMSLAAVLTVYGSFRAPHLFAFSIDSPQIASASSVSHTSAIAPDAQLRPVNLTYADHGGQTRAPVRKVQSLHAPTTHLRPKPQLLRAQDSREIEMMADELARPMMVLSNFPMERPIAPESVLVVFQGEQFGTNGPIFWRVTVLHLTPAQQRAITRGFRKQI